jgi:hypothetical protein
MFGYVREFVPNGVLATCVSADVWVSVNAAASL